MSVRNAVLPHTDALPLDRVARRERLLVDLANAIGVDDVPVFDGRFGVMVQLKTYVGNLSNEDIHDILIRARSSGLGILRAKVTLDPIEFSGRGDCACLKLLFDTEKVIASGAAAGEGHITSPDRLADQLADPFSSARQAGNRDGKPHAHFDQCLDEDSVLGRSVSVQRTSSASDGCEPAPAKRGTP